MHLFTREFFLSVTIIGVFSSFIGETSHEPIKTLLVLAALLSPIAFGQTTTFTDGTHLDPVPGNPTTDSLISTANNWDNGLPQGGTTGTIGISANIERGTTYLEYDIIHTGGTVLATGGTNSRITFAGGRYIQNGGILDGGSRSFSFEDGQELTITTGSVIGRSAGNLVIQDSAIATVNGGALEQQGSNRGMIVQGGATLNINGGNVTTDTTVGGNTNVFGKGRNSTGANFINITGGTTTVDLLGFGRNNGGGTFQLTLTMGVGTGGTFTANDFNTVSSNELESERDINFLAGSLMTMTILNVGGVAGTDWAETEWNAGRLTYNGFNFDTLPDGVVGGATADWDSVIAAGGLDGTYSFEYSGGALSLAVIPEPSSLVLMGLAGFALLALRRRR